MFTKFVKVKGLDKAMSDEEVREITRKELNGAYCVKVCKSCGMYYTKMDGDVNTAKIVSSCDECSEKH